MENADEAAVERIVAAARDTGNGGDADALKAAVRDAAPNDRALAAKELANDTAALDALHGALTQLGIEPDAPDRHPDPEA